MACGFTTAEPLSQHHCIYFVLWTGNIFLKSVTAWPHFSSLKWRLCIAPSQTEDAPRVQLVCSSCHGVWGPDHSRPKGHLSLMPPASHQLFLSTALCLPLGPLFSNGTSTFFFTCRAHWKRIALTQERISDWVVMKPNKVVVNTAVGNLRLLSAWTKQTSPVLSCNDIVRVNGCLGTI